MQQGPYRPLPTVQWDQVDDRHAAEAVGHRAAGSTGSVSCGRIVRMLPSGRATIAMESDESEISFSSCYWRVSSATWRARILTSYLG